MAKYRFGFVTNSSSSSFIIAKKHLDNDQIKAIHNHIELAKLMGYSIDKWDNAWDIVENDKYISGGTWIDNFYMEGFLRDIGVNMKKVDWYDLSEINIDNYGSYEEDEEEIDEWRVLLGKI